MTVFTNWMSAADLVQDGRSDASDLATRVARLVSTDPAEVAACLGVAVNQIELPPTLWGATRGAWRITINSSLNPARQRFALAHELAHVLIRQTHQALGRFDDEEFFADEFARVLLVLHAQRGDPLSVEKWVLLWDGLAASVVQMSELIDDVVVCNRCGPRRRAWACNCSPARTSLTNR